MKDESWICGAGENGRGIAVANTCCNNESMRNEIDWEVKVQSQIIWNLKFAISYIWWSSSVLQKSQVTVCLQINNRNVKMKHLQTFNYFAINVLIQFICAYFKSKTLRDTADRINSNAINYYSCTWQCYGQRVIHCWFVTIVDTLTMQQILGYN